MVKKDKKLAEKNSSFEYDLGVDGNVDKYEEVGSIFKLKRENLKISVSKMSSLLKIKKEYIVMIEEGNHAEANKHIYYLGCIRSIANILDLPAEKILNYLLSDDEVYAIASNTKNGRKEKKSIKKFLDDKKRHILLKNSSAFLLLMICFFLFFSFTKKRKKQVVTDNPVAGSMLALSGDTSV